MPHGRSVFLAAAAFPFLLMQINLSGCLPGTGTGGGGALSFNLPPTIVLSTDVTRGVAPLVVRFSSAGSSDDGLIIDRVWDFGDGQTSREIAPTHTFTATGTYRVALTLRDDANQTSTRTVTIFVTQEPIAIIRVDRTAAESAPAIFNFDATQSFDPDGEITSYQWDFGDGSRELLPVVAHTFASPGTFRTRLTITDNTGVTSQAEQIIEVGIRRPTIQFRSPSAEINNLVVSPDSPLWVSVVFDVTAGTPRMLAAGLDGDADPCDAKAVRYSVGSGALQGEFLGHAGRVRAAVWTPDGASILTASDDQTLRLYNASTGEVRQSYGGNTAIVTSAAVSPDGTLFVCGLGDGGVLVRNTSTGAVLREFRVHTQAVNAVAFSPNGTQVLSGSDDATAILYSVAGGSVVRTFVGHAFGVTAVAFSPRDATLVLTGSVDQTARLWDATNGVNIATFGPQFTSGQLVSGHANSVSGVAISPDGTLVATASDDRTAKLWNITGGTEIRTLTGHTNRLSSVAFSPDGTLLATGGFDGTVRLWTVATGAQLRSLAPCTSPIASVAFSPDGASLAVGVLARNDIKLDTNPIQGNDLNLTVPTALDLRDVAPGTYFLWAEVQTDRTSPVRTYAATTINVVAPFTASIDNFTPRIPLLGDRAAVVVAPTNQRQIFDLGPLAAGDRLFVSLLTTPGYRQVFQDSFYSVLLLDSDRKVIAWYQDSFILLTPETKVTIGHNSQNHFVVVDSGDGVSVRVQRGAGATQRQQRVLLDFVGGQGIRIADEPARNIAPFDAAALGFPPADTAIMKSRILDTVRALYTNWNVVVTTTDQPLPEAPFQRVYFGGAATFDGFYGVADYIDIRNDTLAGAAVVSTEAIRTDFPLLTSTELATYIGETTAHEIGHLLGLRHVDNPNDVMHYVALDAGIAISFTSSPLFGGEQYNTQIGFQDVPQLLDELVGPRP